MANQNPSLRRFKQVVMPEGLERTQVEGVIDEFNSLFEDNTDADVEQRKTSYAKLVNQYYDMVTDFYEYGWGQSFHFAPRHKHESFESSLARHEMYLAYRIGAKKGSRVLDVGCGVGGPARTIANFTEAQVVGINNNMYQVGRFNKLAQDNDLAHLCKAVKGDFMNMPFEDNTFDGIYAIEATCHAPDRTGVFAEAFRCLKPGAIFGSYEWIMTDKYNPEDPEHRRIKHGIEQGDALPDLVGAQEVHNCLKKAGFEIIEARDVVENSPVAWYHPLEAFDFSIRGFASTSTGRWVTDKAIRALETVGVAAKGTTKVHDMLCLGADSLVEGGRHGIFTPAYLVLARKPAN